MAKRILFVDSDPGMRKMISKVLSEEGYDIVTSSHAREAQEQLGESHFDLVITDVLLPDIDGFRFYQIVKHHPRTSAIPFVFLTAKADEEDRLKGLKMGADDYLTKPIRPRELVAKIETILKRAEQIKVDIEGATLAGSLEEQGVAELVQFVDMSNQTGLLLIETRRGKGRIWFEKGKLHSAEFGGLSGEEAVWSLLGEKEGGFRFQKLHAAELEDRQILKDNYAVLLEGLRRQDESQAGVEHKEEDVSMEEFDVGEYASVEDVEIEEVGAAPGTAHRPPYEFPGPNPKEDLVAYLASRPMLKHFIVISTDGTIAHNTFEDAMKAARLVSLAASCSSISKSLMGLDKPARVDIDMGEASVSVYIYQGKVVGVSPAVKELFPPD